MPSGAKRRKAAKKKKEQESNIGSTTNASNNFTNGDDDLKTQDSDGGEVSSPASQEHQQQQHQFSEGRSERESLPVQEFGAENKLSEEVPVAREGTQKSVDGEDEGNIEIVRELKGSPESRDVSTKHGSSSSSSSSSSDDESRDVEKKSVVLDLGESQEGSVDVVQEVSSKRVILIEENESAEEEYSSLVETEGVPDPVEPSVILPENFVHVVATVLPDNSVNTEGKNLELDGNDEKLLPSAANVFESKESEDKALPVSDVNYGETSSARESSSKETEDKLLLSSSAPNTESGNGVGHVKDSTIPEYSEKQTPVAAAPRPVQTSSWKNCCGLFEVLTGSRS